MHKGLVRDVFSINFKLWTAIASASNKPAGIKNYKQSMNFLPHLAHYHCLTRLQFDLKSGM